MFAARYFECEECGKVWEIPYDAPRPDGCPECGCCEIRRSLRGALFDRSVEREYAN
ncbi:MAG: hypothetical protein ACLFUV_07505 [Methanomassiliicoccales archaeon]